MLNWQEISNELYQITVCCMKLCDRVLLKQLIYVSSDTFSDLVRNHPALPAAADMNSTFRKRWRKIYRFSKCVDAINS